MARKGKKNTNDRKLGTIQFRNRCANCGRPRGFLRFFGMCRICVRNMAGNGLLPGVKQSSW
ncbi:type Z 30S ribosomal protein S14 [bacterium]|nr:type Z 30S ribosomal protein S14 [bacterium]